MAALTVRDALAQAAAAGVHRLDAQLLLAHLMHQGRTWLLAHDDATLPPEAEALWHNLLARRASGEPLAYVLGEWPFRGLNLKVTPAVLVPRPETEVLVEWALECLANAPSLDVVDLGTGSGAIALALAQARPDARLLATDVSGDALAVAGTNAAQHGLAVRTAQGSWWAAVGGARFGLAVSNPPYIAPGDPHLAALTHEPPLALTAPEAGLAALRTLVQDAPSHLLPGAWLLLEHGHDQADAVQALLVDRGFEPPCTRRDLAGLPRCTGARWPGVTQYRPSAH